MGVILTLILLGRLIESDADCIAILTKVAAVTGALNAVAVALVDQHLRNCLRRGADAAEPAERAEHIDQALHAIGRLLRT